MISRKEMRTPIEVLLGMNENNMVSAKKLYEFLELAPQNYSRWCKENILENPIIIKDEDYIVAENSMVNSFPHNEENPSIGGRPSQDYLLTIDFAKELCMTCRTEKGKQARKYFKETEKALVVTIKQYDELASQIKSLAKEVTDLRNKSILAPVLSDWGKETQSLLQEIVDHYQSSPFELIRCFGKNTDEAAEIVINKMHIKWDEIVLSYKSKFATDILPQNKFIIIDRLPEYHYDFDHAAKTIIGGMTDAICFK